MLPAKLPPVAAVVPRQAARRPSSGAYERLLASLSKASAAEYERDFRSLAAFMGTPDARSALADLLSRPGPEANALVLEWRDEAREAGLASSTVNRRLASLNAFLRVARLLGLCSWTLEVDSVRHEAKRDPSGPGATSVREIDAELARLATAGDPLATRDLALVRIYSTCLLRRMEPLAIDFPEDLDLGKEPQIRFRGKGKREKSWFPIGAMTADAIRAWLAIRGKEKGPLFITLGNRSSGKRLTIAAVRRLFDRISASHGKRIRPHGLRHTGATTALDMTDGNLRDVSRLTRHAGVAMLQRYDDARTSSPRKLVDELEEILIHGSPSKKGSGKHSRGSGAQVSRLRKRRA